MSVSGLPVFLPWQQSIAQTWLGDRERFSHAWLIHGMAGIGKAFGRSLDLAGDGGLQPGQRAQDRGLADAGRAAQDQRRPRRQREGHPLDRPQPAARDGQIADAKPDQSGISAQATRRPSESVTL